MSASFKVPVGSYSDISKLSMEPASGILSNQRVRIPVVPMDIPYEDNKNAVDTLIDELNALGANRELLVDYEHGSLYIKDGDKLLSVTDLISSNIVNNVEEFKIYFQGTKMTFQEALTLIDNQKLYAQKALIGDPTYVVNNSGVQITMSPDYSSTELIEKDGYTDANGIYYLQLKDFDTAIEGQIPTKDVSGNLKWVTRGEDIVLKSFESAETNTVPVKTSNGSISWMKPLGTTNVLNVEDVSNELSTQLDMAIADKQIVYSEAINHETIVGVGLSQLTVESLTERLAQCEEALRLEKLARSEDTFTTNSRFVGIGYGLTNTIIDCFDGTEINGNIIQGSLITLDLDNHQISVEKPTSGYDFIMFPITDLGEVTTLSFYFSCETEYNLTYTAVIVTPSNTLEYEVESENFINIKVDDEITNFYIKVNTDSNMFVIDNISISYSTL
jgi:hypothetical protein